MFLLSGITCQATFFMQTCHSKLNRCQRTPKTPITERLWDKKTNICLDEAFQWMQCILFSFEQIARLQQSQQCQQFREDLNLFVSESIFLAGMRRKIVLNSFSELCEKCCHPKCQHPRHARMTDEFIQNNNNWNNNSDDNNNNNNIRNNNNNSNRQLELQQQQQTVPDDWNC